MSKTKYQKDKTHYNFKGNHGARSGTGGVVRAVYISGMNKALGSFPSTIKEGMCVCGYVCSYMCAQWKFLKQ